MQKEETAVANGHYVVLAALGVFKKLY